MKTTSSPKAATVLIAAFSFALTPISKAQDAKPKAPEGKGVTEQLLGYWSINGAKMLEAARAEAEAAGQKLEGPEAEMMMKMIETMSKMVVVQFKEGDKVTAHTPDGEEEATYKIAVTDAAKGKFDITVDPPDEEAKTGKARLRGDKLMMKVDGETMHMIRISEAEFKKRKAEIEDFDPSELFQPGNAAPDPEEASEPEPPTKD